MKTAIVFIFVLLLSAIFVQLSGETLSDVAPQMKIYGTGQNFKGVVTSNQVWQSAGNPPHWLVMDGKGDFEGIDFTGLVNVNSITIYLKNKNEVVDKIDIADFTNNSKSSNVVILTTNITKNNQADSLVVSQIQVKFHSTVSATNTLASLDRVKIEFGGTNIVVSNIAVYGMLSGKKDYSVAKQYKMSDEETKNLLLSSEAFGKSDLKQAEELSLIAIRKNPENPYAYMNLGQIYRAAAQKSEEHAGFAEVMKKSVENYEAADRPDNPSRVELDERLAKLYQNNLLDSSNAKDKWAEYIQVLESSGVSNGNKLASALVSGINSIKVGNDPGFEAKMEVVTGLVKNGEVSGNSLDVYNNMCYYISYNLVDKKDYSKAIELAKLVISAFSQQEASGNAIAHQYLAVANMALGSWQDAIEAWKVVNVKATGMKGQDYILLAYSMYKNDNDDSYKWFVYGLGMYYWSSVNATKIQSNVYNKYSDIDGKVSLDVFSSKILNDLEQFLLSEKIFVKNDWINELKKRSNNYMHNYQISLN